MIETSPERSRIMAAVRGKDTKPELAVRRLVHRLGYRYRLHRSELPGKPDLAFIGRRKAIFVHGCFWHGHDCGRGARVPKTNTDYWLGKIARNVARDERVRGELVALGWRSMIVWECELRDLTSVQKRIVGFLDDDEGEDTARNDQ